MQFVAKTGQLDKQTSPCVAIGVYAKGSLTPSAQQVDQATKGQLSQLAKLGDLPEKPGQTLLVHPHGGIKAKRILLVGLGPKDKLTGANFIEATSAAASILKELKIKQALTTLTEAEVEGKDDRWKIRQLVLATAEQLYRYTETLGTDEQKPSPWQACQVFAESAAQGKVIEPWIEQSSAIADAIHRAKTLANLPGNVCTPTYLARTAREIGKRSTKLKVSVLDEAAMKKLGMGSLLSVSRGSRQPAKLITMEYKGGTAKQKPVVLVGKGLTFDAGGISIKPAPGMDEMKYDMCGGASVIAALQMCADLQLPMNVVGIVPSSENLPDGDANKPGDVVTSMAGKTIEVLNTDAEGRLILCDALTYAERFNPDIVIDMATLTGAIIIGLGRHPTGLFANDDKLAEEITQAGELSGDRVWRLPIWDDYQSQLKSSFADIANIGGRDAGSITAACFLSRFTEKYRWAHLDIAGTAWNTGGNKGATGRPVPLLAQLLLDRCES